ncbi:hypothetical protein ABG067_002574 [Albugo candida]
MSSSLSILLSRVNRIYRPHEQVQGEVIITSPNGFAHQGISVKVEGCARLKMNKKTSGIFDSGQSDIPSIELLQYHIPLISGGKVHPGVTKFPFEFQLIGADEQTLYETYHGVCVSVKYEITCDCARGLLKRSLHSSLEFIVETPLQEPLDNGLESFSITSGSVNNVRKQIEANAPDFQITGHIHRTNCPVDLPLTGEVTIARTDVPVKSVEIQLIRVESIIYGDKTARDATEIQNIQIGQGDPCPELAIPIYMIFPRLFTCPTMITPEFRVEFETNLVILFENGNMVTENFPIVLYR